MPETNATDKLLNEDGEVVVPVANGCTLRSASDTFLSGEYVRLCDPEGNELLYWDNTEWQEDPVLVMGAILNAAAGLRADGNPANPNTTTRKGPTVPDMKIKRDADAVIVDDETGTWYAAWNVHEGFDPFTAAIRATSRSAAEEVWFEQFPDRGEPETLHVTECTLSVNVTIAWPDGEVTPEVADNPTT